MSSAINMKPLIHVFRLNPGLVFEMGGGMPAFGLEAVLSRPVRASFSACIEIYQFTYEPGGNELNTQ